MADIDDFKKVRRLIKIYWVVQAFLVLLLVYMALNFQLQFSAQGMPGVFLNSIFTVLVIQLLIFYPINRFAQGEARNEIAAGAANMTLEEQKAIRQKRLFGDVLKTAIFMFFLIFSFKAPGKLFFQSSILFSFIFTLLTYFQCYNYAAKRIMAGKS